MIEVRNSPNKFDKNYCKIKKNIIYLRSPMNFWIWCCLSGGIGRRTGLKILRELNHVPVQVRPEAPFFIGEIPKSG